MARTLPAGTVTFLFTDVEGSTRLLHEFGEKRYSRALEDHRRVLRDAFVRHGGVEVDTQGDAFFVAFPTAPGAIAAASEAREALAGGPIRVRVGVHTGTPFVTPDGYIGPDVHLGARIAAAGHGGQILLSAETRRLLEAGPGDVVDLGEHRLKDFAAPVWIFQLGSESFPPLATISNTNLRRPASAFIGREREVREVIALIRDARFVTLVGPGGTGKTRLAIEAASRLVGSFKSGVFWIGSATIREPSLVMQLVSQTLGARASLADHIGEREMLLVLDNLEQVASVGPHLAALVEACPNLRILATSRERLRVRGERPYEVGTLNDREALELFSSRSGLEADAVAAQLCRALDNLPLAIELAASRASVLTPAQILERLGSRLDLLRGGRDTDPRQQTLRATVDWSHELLDPTERRLFARLSVFAGGATLDAVEAVAESDLDTLQSLVDKSLVRRTDDRFWMLESIRDFAHERLEESGEMPLLRRRHADHYLADAERLSASIHAGDPEEGPVDSLEAEIANLRAAIELGLETGDNDLVRRITATLPMYWTMRGLRREERAWLERALALDDARDRTRLTLLSALAANAYAQGDHQTATAIADEAAALASELAGTQGRVAELRARILAARQRRDYAEAEKLFIERFELALAEGNGVSTSACRLNLAWIANMTARHDRADALLGENLPFVRSKGQARCEAYTFAGMAETAVFRARPEEAVEPALAAATLALQVRENPLALHCLEAVAVAAAARGDDRAATILGATDALRAALELPPDEDEALIRDEAVARIGGASATESEAWKRGRSLDLPAVVELARSVAVSAP